MESQFSEQRDLLLDLLGNIRQAILQLKEWNKDYSDINQLLTSPEGMKTLAADCMLLQALCEGVKQLDKRTSGELLPLQSQIPWKEVKGMRDHIAHGYFDINTDMVWDVITEELEPLLDAINWFITYLEQQ